MNVDINTVMMLFKNIVISSNMIICRKDNLNFWEVAAYTSTVDELMCTI